MFLSGIYRYVFVSRNCLGRELCRYCYQLLLHCFVKYSAGILFAVKVWRLCKWIELYFFACRQRIKFFTREKCFLFGYDIHDCTMYSCMSNQVTMLLKHSLCWPSFSLLISTWQFMKHSSLYFLSGDIFVSIAIFIWTNMLWFTKSGPSFSWSLLRKLSSCAKAAS